MTSSVSKTVAAIAVAAGLVASTSAHAVSVLLIEDQGGFGGASTVLQGDGHTVTTVNNEYANSYGNLTNLSYLQSFDMVVWGARADGFGNTTPTGVLTTLESYIQSGGDLLVTGYDTIGSPDDPGLAALVRSSTFGDFVSGDPTWSVSGVSNFITNGLYGDLRNAVFSDVGYDDDDLTADALAGAIVIAEFSNGRDRVIYTPIAGGGSVGYWNGGLSGTGSDAQPDFSSGTNTEILFRNWVAGIEVNRTDVPEPATLALLGLGIAALGAARRRS